MTVSNTPQSSIYETTIENPELEALLERRDALAEVKSTATKAYKEVDEAAKGLIATLDLGDDATVRIGNHLVTRRVTEGGHVSFERSAGVKYGIRLFGGEE